MPDKKRPQVIFDTQETSQPTGQCDCDCDCACSTYPAPAHGQEGAPYPAPPSALFRRPDSYLLDLDDDYAICYSARHRYAVLNRAAQGLLTHFDRPARLDTLPPGWRQTWGDAVIDEVLQQMIDLGLLVPRGEATPPPARPTTLSAWLHVTDRCNLRCAYCYLPHAPADMSTETGYAAIEATFRSALAHGYSRVKLKYAGGEPLLRFPFILDLQRHAQTLGDEHGLTLDGVILTNGTPLTPEIIRRIQASRLRLMISLDGLGQHHDRQRHFADGRGSFDAVSDAIELALSHGLVPDISVTVSGRNADGLPALVAWLLARDLPFSLNFYRENDRSATDQELRLETLKIIAGMRAAFQVIEANLPRRSLLASLVDRANLHAYHQRPCSVADSYLVFDPDGQVAKCQMDMAQPVTDARHLDPLARVRQSRRGVDNPPVDHKEGCGTCRWRYWCAGGCPLQAYRASGRYDARSPNCEIYCALYPEAIRLEGLRLLRQAGD